MWQDSYFISQRLVKSSLRVKLISYYSANEECNKLSIPYWISSLLQSLLGFATQLVNSAVTL